MSEFLKVIKNGTCIGCGYCSSFTNSKMQFNKHGFLEPEIDELKALSLSESTKIDHSCPGLNGADVVACNEKDNNCDYMWGKYNFVGTAYSSDPHIRHLGSSGGAITAISSWLLKSGRVNSVLNTVYSNKEPISTESKISNNLDELPDGAGSKYSPSSPLSILGGLRGKGGVHAIIGRPCDISTLRRAIESSNDFCKEKFVLIAFFCAGTPSRKGNEELLEYIGIDNPEEVIKFRHRGNGWPGFTTAILRDGTSKQCTYNEAWGGILRRHTNALCKICPDGIGEQADIVAADAWYGDSGGYPDFDEKDGRSLLISRSEVGLSLVKAAIKEGALISEPLSIREIDAMQPGQLNRRKQLRMRVLAFKFLGRKTPSYNLSALKKYERGMSRVNKIKVFFKTLKKIIGQYRS